MPGRGVKKFVRILESWYQGNVRLKSLFVFFLGWIVEFCIAGSKCLIKRMFNSSFEGVLNLPDLQRIVIVDDGGKAAYTGSRLPVTENRDCYEVMLEPGTGKMGVVAKATSNGWLHDKSVTVNVPMLTRELMSWVELNAERRWLVFVADSNGNKWLMGRDGRGAMMQVQGEVNGNQNGYVLGWSLSSKDMWYGDDFDFDKIAMGTVTIDLRQYVARDIVVCKGDTMSVDFEFESNPGVAEVLTGNVFSCTVLNASGGTVVSFAMNAGFTLPTTTKLRMAKTAAETVTWAAGEHTYEIWRTKPDGTKYKAFKGAFVVE